MSKLFTLQEAAKEIGISRTLLFAFLRKNDFLNKFNLPRERYVAKDLFHTRHLKFFHPVLGEQISSRTLITKKGIDYIHELLRHKAPETLCPRNSLAANEDRANSCTRASA